MLRAAMKDVARRWRVVVGLALLNVLVAAFAARPFGAGLAAVLDHRPGAAALAAGDDGLLVEVLSDHPALARAAGSAAQAALLLQGLLAWVLAGAVLASVALAERRGVRALLEAAATHAPRMLAVGALGLIARLAPIAVGILAGLAVAPLARDRGLGPLAAGATLVGLVFALAWSFTTVALDRARALAILDGALPVLRALKAGVVRTVRRPGAPLAIAAFAVVGFVAVTALQQALALRTDSPGLRLAVRGLGAFGRAWVATVALVAAGRLALGAAEPPGANAREL